MLFLLGLKSAQLTKKVGALHKEVRGLKESMKCLQQECDAIAEREIAPKGAWRTVYIIFIWVRFGIQYTLV